VRRRAFIAGLGSAAAWPVVARGQQTEPVRRIAVLMNLSDGDREAQARLAAFHQGLQELDWIEGRNIHLEIRWAAGDAARFRSYAAELVALVPDVILAASGTAVPRRRRDLRAGPMPTLARPPNASHRVPATRFADKATSMPLRPEGRLRTIRDEQADGRHFWAQNRGKPGGRLLGGFG